MIDERVILWEYIHERLGTCIIKQDFDITVNLLEAAIFCSKPPINCEAYLKMIDISNDDINVDHFEGKKIM